MLSVFFIIAGLIILLYSLYQFIRQKITQGANLEEVSRLVIREGIQPHSQSHIFRGPLTIYYATQTGTAAGFAKAIAKEGRHQGVVCVVKNIGECSVEELSRQKHAVFLISTHYEGEPTDDMKEFWKGFNRLKPASILGGLKYTGFALGDLNYKLYCHMGRQLNSKLESLGAQSVYTFGEGSNDQGKIDEYFEEWVIPMWNPLIEILPVMDEKEALTILSQSDPSNFIASVSQKKEESQMSSANNLDYQIDTSTKVPSI